VLKAHGIGLNKNVTCYPSFEKDLAGSYNFVNETVVQDGKLITSQGPATVIPFSLKIAENLAGEKNAKGVAKGILFK
jgi:putative intracellular protease/amidase